MLHARVRPAIHRSRDRAVCPFFILLQNGLRNHITFVANRHKFEGTPTLIDCDLIRQIAIHAAAAHPFEMPKMSVADRSHPVAPCFEKHIAVFQNRIRRKNRKPVGLHRISGKNPRPAPRAQKQAAPSTAASFVSFRSSSRFFLPFQEHSLYKTTDPLHFFPYISACPTAEGCKASNACSRGRFRAVSDIGQNLPLQRIFAPQREVFLYSPFFYPFFRGSSLCSESRFCSSPSRLFIRRSQRNPRRRYPARRSYRRAKIWRCPSCPRR